MRQLITKNLWLEKDKNGKFVLTGTPGSNITDIIIDAIAYVKVSKDFDKIKLANLNGVNLKIDKKTTFSSAMNRWNKVKKEYEAKAIREHKEWLRTPEGQEYTRQKEQEQAEHDAYVFHSVDEALLALSDVEPCYLFHFNTTHEDAIRFCKEIMDIIQRCQDLHFEPEQQKEFSSMLTILGASGNDKLAEKFISGETSIGALMNTKNNIEFPASVFDQLIDADINKFNFNLSLVTDGGLKNSWIGGWLKTQKEHEKSLKNNN